MAWLAWIDQLGWFSWSAFTDRRCRFDTSKLFKSSSPIRTIYRHQSITIKQLPFNLWYREEIMSFKVVFQGWEGEMDWWITSWNSKPSRLPSHLSYIKTSYFHYKDIVKVHRVLPSNRLISASSRRIQFHWGHVGDSGAIVTPFMRVATYATRNFATLGLLELQPPFTGLSIQCLNISC